MAKQLQPLDVQPSATGGPSHHSILDGIITGIFGPSTDEMTQAEGVKVQNQRHSQAVKAADMATSARMNPGKEFMNGPEASGGSGTDILKVIGGIAKLFQHG